MTRSPWWCSLASGDVLQFLKAGIMEVPDVLVVTKADLEDAAARSRRDLAQALAAVGSSEMPVLAVSSVAPPSGVEELADALDADRDARTSPSAACAPAAVRRCGSSRSSTASARCATSAGAGRPSACSSARTRQRV